MAMSPEERKARDRERKRRSRAAAAAERAAAHAARHTASDGAPSTVMHDAVESALAAAKWLSGSDAASMAQARKLATRIDALEDADETTKALSAHRALSQVLNDLGVTATRRMQYELRSRKFTADSEDDDERDAGESAAARTRAGNVTQLRRPAKRAR